MKPLLSALAGVGLSVMLALLGAVLISLGTGLSPSATDQWVISVGVFELLVWLLSIAAFFSWNRGLATAPRVLATIGFALANLLGLVVALGIAMVVLKR